PKNRDWGNHKQWRTKRRRRGYEKYLKSLGFYPTPKELDQLLQHKSHNRGMDIFTWYVGCKMTPIKLKWFEKKECCVLAANGVRVCTRCGDLKPITSFKKQGGRGG